MRYLEYSFVETGNILFSAFGKQFDIQDDFSPSTLSFSLDRNDPVNDDFTGAFVKVNIDGKEHKTYFIIGGKAVDYVTEDGIPAVAYSAASIHHEFEDAPILPSAWPNPTPSGHDFQNATPGNIVKTLISRLQEFGYLTNIDISSFTGTHDSNGVTWPAVLDRSYTTGDTVLSVIQGLFSEGSCDAEMDGYSLNLYIPDTLDKTLTPDEVTLRVGQNLDSGETQTDSTDFYTDIFAIGDGDAAVMKSRPDSYNVLGRRRLRFAQYAGITNASLLGVMADIELDQYNHIKSEHTYSVSPDFYTPFVDYDVHNLVPLDRGDGVLENIRIKQISVTQSDDDGSFSVGVTLGDLLEDADEKLKRRLDAITGANAGGGGVPSDKADDKNPPQWPASVAITSLSYIDASTNPKVAALVDWPDVTTNSDGTPADDIDHYEFQYRVAPATPPGGTPTPITSITYSASTTTTDSKAYLDNFEANTQIQVRVRTVDTSGLVSPQWTESVPTTLVRTGGTLIAPSIPTVSPIFQGLKISWDGLDSNGNTPTGEWIAVAIHISTAGTSFTPTSATKVDTLNIVGGQLVAKVTTIPGLLPGTTYWVKLVAVGRDGGASSPSASASATTAKLISDDLTPKFIDAAQFIQDGTVNTAQLNVATFSEQMIPNADFEGGYTGTLPNTWAQTDIFVGSGNSNPTILTGASAISGSVSWQHTVAPGDGRVWRSSIVSLVPGDIYYFSSTIKTSRLLATANSITIGLAYAADNNISSFSAAGISGRIQYPLVAFTGSTTGQKVEGQFSVPAGMKFGCIFLQISADSLATTNVTAVFDDIQLRRVEGTANIANAAINNAQVANAAIDDLKVSNVSVTKLIAGVLSADMTVSSRIKTADTGARVELNAAGVQGYNSSGSLVTQLTTDGGLISQYFRTNTTGSRIEMGTYANGGNAVNIAFIDSSSSWLFPPTVGFGGGGSVGSSTMMMHSGSRSTSDYNTYGFTAISIDQKTGISIGTGTKLDGTEASSGTSIVINAGGTAGKVILQGGGASRAVLVLDSDAGPSSSSKLNLPYGHVSFNAGGSDSNGMFRSSIAWAPAGMPADHMVIGAGGGFRVTSYTNTDKIFAVAQNGQVTGNGSWGTAKLQTLDADSYYSFNNSGDFHRNGSGTVTKTFVIAHPKDETKYLVHATNEMPENRVDYTGNSKLIPATPVLGPSSSNFKNNFIGANDVEIVLPDYFPYLVDENADTTTVMVSPYYHDCDGCGYHGTPTIAATRIKDGKFRVKATGGHYHPCISFAWRVSAVRKDVPALEVEPQKSDYELHGDGPYTYITKKA